MTDGEIREIVIGLFEDFRQSHGSHFEEDRFMAFLTANPVSKGKRHADTFNGCRRFWRFTNAVQLKFGVCFTNKELDRGFSLSEMVALIQTKQRNPLQGKRLADKLLREAVVERKDKTVIWSLAVAAPLAIPAAFMGVAGKFILGLVWAGAAIAIYCYHSRQIVYARRLVESVDEALELTGWDYQADNKLV